MYCCVTHHGIALEFTIRFKQEPSGLRTIHVEGVSELEGYRISLWDEFGALLTTAKDYLRGESVVLPKEIISHLLYGPISDTDAPL